jgi:hypothetical protein
MIWRNLKQAAEYLGPTRSPRFVAREIKSGRLRAAQIGGRGEYLTCDAWLDDYVESMAKPVPVPMRRRG